MKKMLDLFILMMMSYMRFRYIFKTRKDAVPNRLPQIAGVSRTGQAT